jgi:hypothetical protein
MGIIHMDLNETPGTRIGDNPSQPVSGWTGLVRLRLESHDRSFRRLKRHGGIYIQFFAMTFNNVDNLISCHFHFQRKGLASYRH